MNILPIYCELTIANFASVQIAVNLSASHLLPLFLSLFNQATVVFISISKEPSSTMDLDKQFQVA